MDVKKLIVGGFVIVYIAIFWWGAFYHASDYPNEVFPCLFSSSGQCAFLALKPGIAYPSIVFWIGISACAVGIILRISLKKSQEELDPQASSSKFWEKVYRLNREKSAVSSSGNDQEHPQ